MTTTTQKQNFSLEYVDIIGKGVDAFNRRRERNDHTEVTTDSLQASIDKVKVKNSKSFKALRAAAVQRASGK